MHGSNGEAALGQFIVNFLGFALSARKDHGEPTTFCLHDSRDQFDFVHRVCTPHVLLDCVNRCAFVIGVCCADMCWLRHIATGEIDNLSGHGG